MRGVSPEVHYDLHRFERVKIQVVVTAPDSQLLNIQSVNRLVTILDEVNKHDPWSVQMLQDVTQSHADHIIHIPLCSISKLEGVQLAYSNDIQVGQQVFQMTS